MKTTLKIEDLTPQEIEDFLKMKAEEAQKIVFLEVTARNVIKSTRTNVETLLQHYNITIHYNEMTKEIEIDIPGTNFHKDTELNSKVSHLVDLAKQNDFNITRNDLDGVIGLIASDNAYHPVREWIDAVEWDGQDRLPEYYATVNLGANSRLAGTTLKETLMRKWALSLAAALYHDDFSCEGVLCLHGRQGIGKTSWAYGLVPRMGRYWIKDAVALDVHNKDSVTKAVSTWITELGELDATFKKSDLEGIKAWVTEKIDVIRPPYERKANKYSRRTAFYATLNTLEFLNDDENRRFWVLDVDSFARPEFDLQQFWAQMRVLYHAVVPGMQDSITTGEYGWYLTPQERARLQTSQQPFKTVDPVEERLSVHVVLPKMMRTARGETLTVTQILERCGVDRITKKETIVGGRWLRQQGFVSDAQRKFIVEIVDQVKTLPHLRVVDDY